MLLDKEEGLEILFIAGFWSLKKNLAAFHVDVVTPVVEGCVVPDTVFPQFLKSDLI